MASRQSTRVWQHLILSVLVTLCFTQSLGLAGDELAPQASAPPPPSLAESLRDVQIRGPFFSADLPVAIDQETAPRYGLARAVFLERKDDGTFGHGTSSVVALSPSGRGLAAGYVDGAVRLFAAQETKNESRPQSCSELVVYRDHAQSIEALAFSPDGRQLASGDRHGVVIIHEVANGKILATLHMAPGNVNFLSYSPDGQLLLATTGQKGARTCVYDVASTQMLWEVKSGKRPAWTPDSRWAALPQSESIAIYAARTGAVERSIESKELSFDAVAISPDGKQLAALKDGSDVGLVLYEFASGTQQNSAVVKYAKSLEYIQQGKFLVVDAGQTELWDPQTAKRLCQLDSSTRQLKFSADGKYAAKANFSSPSVYDVSLLFNFPFLRAVKKLEQQGCEFHIERDVLVIEPKRDNFTLDGLAELQVPLAIRAGSRDVSDASLAAVAANPQVIEIDFHFCKGLTDEGVKQLARLPHLRQLTLKFTEKLTRAGIETLAGMSELKTLDLQFGDSGNAGIARLAALTQLESLTLPDGVTDAGFLPLAALVNLKSLGTGSSQLSDRGLAALAGMTRLTRLYISGEQLMGEGLVHLAGLKQLESLELYHLKPMDDRGLSNLPSLPALKELSVQGSKVLFDEALKPIGRQVNLEKLVLDSCNHITCKRFVDLQGLKQLSEIKLDGCYAMNGEGLEALAALPKITTLDLRSMELSEAGIQCVAKIVQLRRLAVPEGISDDGLKTLLALPHLESLTYDKLSIASGPGLIALAKARGFKTLNLIDTAADDAGLAGLSECVDLETLSLPVTITDAGLAQVAGLRKLKSLNLESSKITDAGLKHLAGLTELTDLNLSKTAITNAGLIHLKNLTLVDYPRCYGTQVTDEELKKLRLAQAPYAAELRHVQLKVPEKESVHEIRFSPDGQTVACSVGTQFGVGALHVLDAATMQPRFVRPNEREIRGLPNAAFLPDSKSFVAQGTYNELVRCDTLTGEKLGTYPVPDRLSRPHCQMAVRGTKTVLNTDSAVAVGQFPPSDQWTDIEGADRSRQAAVDPEGLWLYCTDGEERTVLWSLETNQRESQWADHFRKVEAVGVSRSRKFLASRDDGQRLIVRDGQSGQRLWENVHAARRLLFSADDRFLIFIEDRSPARLVIVEASTGRHVRTWKGPAENFDSLALMPDGKTVVTGEVEGVLRFWELPAAMPQ